MSLNYVPAHCGHVGNERADFLAKQGSFCGSFVHDVELSFGAFKQFLNAKLKLKLEERWKAEITNPTSFQLVPNRNCLKRIQILGQKTQNMKLLHWFLTGSCPLRKYLFTIKKSFTDKCLFCPDEIETRAHFILHCSRYEALRGKLIHKFQMGKWPTNLSDFSNIKDGYHILLNYIELSKRFGKDKKSKKFYLLYINIAALLNFSVKCDAHFALLVALCITCLSLYSV